MWRKLKHNAATRTPTSIICVDTESFEIKTNADGDEWQYPLRCGTCVYFRYDKGKITREHISHFTTVEGFWNLVRMHMSHDRPLWIFAHNLGWDLSVLRFWREIEEGRFRLSGPPRNVINKQSGKMEIKRAKGLLVTADPPTMLSVWDDKGRKLKGMDTFNWFNCSLARLGEYEQLPKLEMPNNLDTLETWQSYCNRDCMILALTVARLLGFVVKHDLGVFKYTPASQSMALYKHRCKLHDVVLHDNDTAREMEQEAYFGGRNYCYFQGEVKVHNYWRLQSDTPQTHTLPMEYAAPIHVLDVNAAYAYIMLGNMFPNCLTKVVTDIDPDRLRQEIYKKCCVARVGIVDRARMYQVRKDHMVRWCTGCLKTTLCGDDLLTALNAGVVNKVYCAAIYTQQPLLHKFAQECLAMEAEYKDKSDFAAAAIVKSLRNCLHGKFGQHGHRWEVLPGEVAPHAWGHYTRQEIGNPEPTLLRAIGGQVQKLFTDTLAPEAFPAIAAYVTSYFRQYMSHLMRLAGIGNTFYEDADSIHVSKTGFNNLLNHKKIGEQPGQLKHMLEPAYSGTYYAPKHYQLDDTIVNAGLPFNYEDIGNGAYATRIFARINDTIAKPPLAGPRIKKLQCTYPFHYLAAIPTNSGWTKPIVLDDDLSMWARVDQSEVGSDKSCLGGP